MAIDENKIVRQDLDFIADSKEALVTEAPRFARYTLYLLVSILVTTLIWASVSQIDIVTVVQGRVTSSANLQVIQNLEGGIIKTINVKEGQSVKQSQVLVTLDNTQFSAAYQRDLAKQTLLELEIIRLSAEAEGADKLVIPDDLRKNNPDMVKSTQEYFDRERTALNEQLAILRKNLDLTLRELAIVNPLAQRGAMSTIEKIRLEREVNRLKVQIAERIDKDRTDSRDRLNQRQADLAILQEQLRSSADRNERTIMRSPMDGVVNKLYISTIGEVINPGVKVVEVVPGNDALTIVVNVQPNDIGFLNIGQKAAVKISAYDYSVYGSLGATITNIGADALTDKDGKPYYEVKLKADRDYLGDDIKKLRIIPGMQVTANVLTGRRTLLEYIIKPFIDVSSSAFKTR